MWVIYAQTEPYLGVSSDDVIAAVKANPEARFVLPPWMPRPVSAVVTACWDAHAAARPDFAGARDALGDYYLDPEIGGIAADAYL